MAIVVVGAGVHGLAAARALARRGHAVVVLERARVGHPRGSSHGTARIFRLSYPVEQDVRLAQEALPLWRSLERESGETLLLTTGTLDAGPHADAVEPALAACEVASERLAGDEVERRFGLTLAGGALYQPDGGVLLADRCLAALAGGARAAGAELREDTAVHRLDVGDDRVRVESAAGDLDAEAVVVAAGPWAPGLLATANIELDAVPTRETVAYLRPARDGRPPAVVDEPRPGRIAYALAAPGVGVKAGVHQTGPVADPDEDGPPSAEVAEEAAEWARSVYGPGEVVGVETCLYTNRPGDRFALERHGRVVVGSACSGHGFKFAPAVGERLASLAEEAVR